MKGGSYHSISYKMVWNINYSIMACTTGYVRDSPGIDGLSKLGTTD